jgi:hypothetical protein
MHLRPNFVNQPRHRRIYGCSAFFSHNRDKKVRRLKIRQSRYDAERFRLCW